MTKEEHQKKLIPLYAEMSKLTEPECRSVCRVPLSCCSPEYCEQAMEVARRWNVKLVKTDHATLPFMGPKGCVVPPHLRPLCTLHTCRINAFGFKPGDENWTKTYFVLRAQIELLEMEIFIEELEDEKKQD